MSTADQRLADLYSLHASAAVRLAWLLTGDEQAAQDVAQEAFVRLGARILKLRDPENAAGYLFRVVQNLCKDHGRARSRESQLRARLASSTVEAERDVESGDELSRALRNLKSRYRTVLFLRYYLDQSEEEAARTLQLSVSATKALTHRAAQALRKELGESHGRP